ncbi:non-ribosomal peptide synthetase [Flavobacterium alvei]|uniref:Non-ribosomal peptide synthetase n=1 Tax=Flavobacterium alvei TaxID=2080416 RepID=A0A2S5A982_9FLAO|nr:non-ribosomal peptide synthetase [Flavobacterium alvei]POY38673.1 non-ribosomal peptide synthetase [Flavobacterium alvei]
MLKENTKFDPFSGPEIESVVFTTKSQSEIWTACYFGGSDAARAYNESISMEFNGSLDSIAMDRAIQTLVERHESLRATFSTDGVYMSIYKQYPTKITHLDLSNLDEIGKKEGVNKYISKDAHFLFDLVHGPLIKFGLLKLSNTEHQLVVTAHHIICDGWSIGIMLQDLGAIYSANVENKIPDLPESIQFIAYANEEQLFSNSEENKEIEAYWLKMYEESIPIVNVPTDNARPSLKTYKSHRLDFAFDPNLLLKLKQTGLSVGSSLVTTLLTSFEIFLYQLTGQDDIVVGMPAAGQPAVDMNHLIGHCVNLLPLRSKINPNMSFKDYLKQRKSELFDAYDHQHLSFGHLLQKLKIARDPSRIPLVPIVFNIDLGMTDGVHFSNLTYQLISNPRAFEVFDIFLNASGNEKNLVFEWSYNEVLFKPETIQKMMTSFEKIVELVVEDPSKTLGEITFQDFTSKYDEINATKTSYPNVSLYDLFVLQAQQSPKNIALEYLDNVISYEDLQRQTNQMSHYLKDQGLVAGDFIAVSLPRSPELLISLLAIMQCGAAYLPLDNEYPISRLQFMLEDSKAKFLLTSKTISNSLPKLGNTILIEQAVASLNQYPVTKLQTKVTPEDLAYILYTSGSTGNPKGVPITHKNLVNFLCSMALEPGINENDRLLSITTISFDIAGLELYLPLIKGATLILADQETARDGRLLLELIENGNINFLQATPTTWLMLLDSGWSKKLPLKALCGGEAMPVDLAKDLLIKCDSLWNMYGPTETTIWSSIKQIKTDQSIITIGKPIANTQIYIIDDQCQLVAPGNIGEIAIGGDGVAKGYWNRPELTSEKFIENKFSTNKDNLLYRTGDLGRILSNNEIECLGRLDQQVKIRGHRIEPGEVEQALIVLEGIKYAVVLANENFLIAHIVPESDIESAEIQIPRWREALASQLPPHLVPQDFNLLEKLPKTLNGKIDRKALSEYKTNKIINYTAPRTEEERLVASIWQESLNLEQVDIFSNFFEIGGHSIKAVKVIIEIEKHINKRIPLSSLFEYSTVEKFAKLLETNNESYSNCIVPIKPKGNKVPLFIIHGAGLNVLNFVSMSKHFDEDQPVFGIQGTGPNGYDNWYESIESMAAHYINAIEKINPDGPYALAGFSFGGIVAFEMTRQLKEKGKKVSLTALLDSYVDSSYYYKIYRDKKIIRYFDVTKRRFDFLKEMLTSWKGFKFRINAKKEHILKNYFGVKDKMTDEETLSLEQFTIANNMVQKIVDRYHLKPQNLEVDLFRSKDDMNYKLDPTHLGWKKAAIKGVNIHNIPGNHLGIVDPPNDKVLAKMLQTILDEKHIKIVLLILQFSLN